MSALHHSELGLTYQDSVINATTIQCSFDRTQGRINKLVNTFWYSSLVFSIASAVNSLVSVMWRQAGYQSPGHRVPRFFVIWIHNAPLVFFVISVLAFSVGLCLFTWATDQPTWMCTLVTVFTSCSSFGLFAFCSWFAFERLVYLQYRGGRWLDNVIAEESKGSGRRPAWTGCGVTFRRQVSPMPKTTPTSQMSRCTVIQAYSQRTRTRTKCRRRLERKLCPLSSNVAFAPMLDQPPSSAPYSHIIQLNAPASIATAEDIPSPVSHSGSPKPEASRLQNAIRSITAARQSSTLPTARRVSGLLPAPQSSGAAVEPLSQRSMISQNPVPLAADRMAQLAQTREELSQIRVPLLIPVHQDDVLHVAFSPNGKQLATCSSDRTVAIVTLEVLVSPSVFYIWACPSHLMPTGPFFASCSC